MGLLPATVVDPALGVSRGCVCSVQAEISRRRSSTRGPPPRPTSSPATSHPTRGLFTDGSTHCWGTFSEGRTKKLKHLSFGVFPDDLPRFGHWLQQQGITRLDPPAGTDSDGLWFQDCDGLLRTTAQAGKRLLPVGTRTSRGLRRERRSRIATATRGYPVHAISRRAREEHHVRIPPVLILWLRLTYVRDMSHADAFERAKEGSDD
ncbi:hypothetical protein [Streptomyces gilvosporeus]|uniref:hypothetical protein n=1 Tax=Streptomyces gilvosporeus TaxID=553510 RepID=UPI00131B4DC3|nr:hypothetical protein [Streptomyces gilvosporeus]